MDESRGEYLELHRALTSLGGRLETVAAICDQVRQIPTWVRTFTNQSTVESSQSAVTWAEHEHLSWALGESVRLAMKAHRSLRKDAGLWREIEAVARDRTVGKGREPFVMLLGQYGRAERPLVLFELLADPELVGHALYALRLRRVPGAEARATELLEHPRAWIRAEARKYLKVPRPAA